ncbi:MAG TPA: PadR family transcriptional regulator [Thermoleophilaceae bacterium]|jgi:PadR family transcriptional regulator AphA|nr:PadR family transcriptional regulator [Actinomycetota bacterium]HYN50518.1 PadR family transcriptional regulator [Thermoleophilaceae bacterium]
MQLTPTSYIVLGLLEWFGEATPYALKRIVAGSIGNFWTLHHAQLYSEPERLAKGGYVTVERERGGRRRKTYAITDSGREAVAAWRAQSTDSIPELRSPALLKLFFGADPGELAPVQLDAHRRKLAEYERIRDTMPESVPEGPRMALDAGIANERQQIAWWNEVMVSRS